MYSTLWSSIKANEEYGEWKPKTALYGIYDTEISIKGRDTLPPLTTDGLRWKRLIINSSRNARIITMTDSTSRMAFFVDTLQKTARFTAREDSTILFNFRYRLPDKDHLILEGNTNNDSLHITMKRFDLARFPLLSRGFHWINEYPLNK